MPLFALLSDRPSDHFGAKNHPLKLSNVPVRQPSTVVSQARKHRQTADTTVRIDKCLLLAWYLYFLLSVSWFFWRPWGYERKIFLSASIIPVTSILERCFCWYLLLYIVWCAFLMFTYIYTVMYKYFGINVFKFVVSTALAFSHPKISTHIFVFLLYRFLQFLGSYLYNFFLPSLSFILFLTCLV